MNTYTQEEIEKLAIFGKGVLNILENVYDDVLEEIENLAIEQGMIRFESIHPSLIDVAIFGPKLIHPDLTAKSSFNNPNK